MRIPVPLVVTVRFALELGVWIVEAEPLPTFIVAPLTVSDPPRVVSPVPVVIGLLVVVLRDKVVAEVRSIIGDDPVRFIDVAALLSVNAFRVIVDPAPALSGVKVMFPAVCPPIVMFCAFVVERTPPPVRYVALFPEEAEILAVGVPVNTLITANLALEVLCPPIEKSTVELFG